MQLIHCPRPQCCQLEAAFPNFGRPGAAAGSPRVQNHVSRSRFQVRTGELPAKTEGKGFGHGGSAREPGAGPARGPQARTAAPLFARGFPGPAGTGAARRGRPCPEAGGPGGGGPSRGSRARPQPASGGSLLFLASAALPPRPSRVQVSSRGQSVSAEALFRGPGRGGGRCAPAPASGTSPGSQRFVPAGLHTRWRREEGGAPSLPARERGRASRAGAAAAAAGAEPAARDRLRRAGEKAARAPRRHSRRRRPRARDGGGTGSPAAPRHLLLLALLPAAARAPGAGRRGRQERLPAAVPRIQHSNIHSILFSGGANGYTLN